MLVYYVVFGVGLLTSHALAARDMPIVREELQKYFLCEALPNPTHSCMKNYQHYYLPVIFSLAIVLLALFPVVNLIFVVDLDELKILIGWLRRKISITVKPTE